VIIHTAVQYKFRGGLNFNFKLTALSLLCQQFEWSVHRASTVSQVRRDCKQIKAVTAGYLKITRTHWGALGDIQNIFNIFFAHSRPLSLASIARAFEEKNTTKIDVWDGLMFQSRANENGFLLVLFEFNFPVLFLNHFLRVVGDKGQSRHFKKTSSHCTPVTVRVRKLSLRALKYNLREISSL